MIYFSHYWQWKILIAACLIVGGGAVFSLLPILNHPENHPAWNWLFWAGLSLALIGLILFALIFPNS